MALPLPDYKWTSSQIKEALVEARGNLSEAARFLVRKWGDSCSRTYIKEACEKRPDLLGFYEDLRAEFIDKAETNIFDAVMAGDLRVSMQVAMTLGKDRGWSQKSEIEVVDHEGSVQRIHEARERAKELRKMQALATSSKDPLGDALTTEAQSESKQPCGECHLNPGEKCNICGATASEGISVG